MSARYMMEIEKLLIASVKAYPPLYDKRAKHEAELAEQAWMQVAIECNLGNVELAKRLWSVLISKYIKYLITGAECPFSDDLEFMQQHLIGKNLMEDAVPEITDLHRLLESDTENEPELKRLKKLPFQNVTLTSSGGKVVPLKNCVVLGDTEQNIPPQAIATTTTANTTVATTANTTVTTAPIARAELGARDCGLTPLELCFLAFAKRLQKMPLSVQKQTKMKIAATIEGVEINLVSEQFKKRCD